MENTVIKALPFDQYQALPGINASALKHGMRSMLHLREYLDQPQQPPTDSMLLGTALHAAVLEPDKYNTEFVVIPRPCDCAAVASDWDAYCEKNADRTEDWRETNFRKTKAWTVYMSRFGIDHAGANTLTHEQAEAVKAMSTALAEHPGASALLQGSDTEVTLQWSGWRNVACKARLDAVNHDRQIVVDVKTTQDASRDAFQRQIANLYYHIQAAFYLDAAGTCLGDKPWSFVWIVVENKAPYAVAVYRASAQVVDVGWTHAARLLSEYADCTAADLWTGYPATIQEMNLPRWAALDIEDVA